MIDGNGGTALLRILAVEVNVAVVWIGTRVKIQNVGSSRGSGGKLLFVQWSNAYEDANVGRRLGCHGECGN